MATLGTSGDPRPSDPAFHAAIITKSDTVDLDYVSTAIYVGGTGHMQVTMAGGEIVLFSNLPVGWHPIRASRVWSTNTTATLMVAVWNR